MTVKYLFLFVVPFLLGACQMYPVYSIAPVTGGIYPHTERSIVGVINNDVRIFLNYDYQAGEYYSFFVFIQNKSDIPVTVYPADFYMEAFVSEDIESESPEIFYAVDPENEIQAIKNDLLRLFSDKQYEDSADSAHIDWLLSFGLKHETSDTKNKIVEREEIYLENKYYLEKELSHWEDEALRTATLKPSGKTAGVLYIPVYKRANWFRIIIPVNKMEYMFNFKQVEQLMPYVTFYLD